MTVATSEMNRVWIPHRIAIHVTPEELRNHLAKSLPDHVTQPPTFEATDADQDLAQNSTTPPDPPHVRPSQLQPARVRDILESNLPPRFSFSRKLLPRPRPPPKQQPKEQRVRGAGNDLLAVRAASLKEQQEQHPSEAGQAIYGAVSTEDVRQAILASLAAASAESSRVVLSAEDVTLVWEDDAVQDKTKIRHTGEVPVEIRIPGHDAIVRRLVSVNGETAQAT